MAMNAHLDMHEACHLTRGPPSFPILAAVSGAQVIPIALIAIGAAVLLILLRV